MWFGGCWSDQTRGGRGLTLRRRFGAVRASSTIVGPPSIAIVSPAFIWYRLRSSTWPLTVTWPLPITILASPPLWTPPPSLSTWVRLIGRSSSVMVAWWVFFTGFVVPLGLPPRTVRRIRPPFPVGGPPKPISSQGDVLTRLGDHDDCRPGSTRSARGGWNARAKRPGIPDRPHPPHIVNAVASRCPPQDGPKPGGIAPARLFRELLLHLHSPFRWPQSTPPASDPATNPLRSGRSEPRQELGQRAFQNGYSSASGTMIAPVSEEWFRPRRPRLCESLAYK